MAGISYFGSADGYDAKLERHPWDVVKVGSYTLPGICEIRGLKSERDKQTLKGAKTDGAKKVWRGYKPAEFEIRVTVWTKEQFEELNSIIEKIWSKPDKKEPEVYSITHAQCARLGIKQISVVTVLGLEPGKHEDTMVQTLKVQEHREPKHEVKPKPKTNTAGQDFANVTRVANQLIDLERRREIAAGPGSEKITEVDGQIVSRETFVTPRQ